MTVFTVTTAGLWIAGLQTAYESPALLMAMNLLFSTFVSLVIAFLVARSFLASGQPGLRILGSGMLIWGVACGGTWVICSVPRPESAPARKAL